MECDSQASLLARSFANLCLGCKPKVRFVTISLFKFKQTCPYPTSSLVRNLFFLWVTMSICCNYCHYHHLFIKSNWDYNLKLLSYSWFNRQGAQKSAVHQTQRNTMTITIAIRPPPVHQFWFIVHSPCGWLSLYFHISTCGQIWLNHFRNDSHFGYIKKLKKETMPYIWHLFH
jgi:hypothetical protein